MLDEYEIRQWIRDSRLSWYSDFGLIVTMKIAVIGAGVVGMNTALEFQNNFPNADITVIAENFNEETTSDGAAGYSTHRQVSWVHLMKGWVKNSFSYYKNLKDTANAGVIGVSGYIFSNESQSVCENAYLKLVSPDYRPATSEELENDGNGNFKFGTFLSTMVIPCRKYLPWSLQKFEENGGKVIQTKVSSLNTVTEEYDVIFNCTGLGAKLLCNDIEVVPIRGQLIQVEAPWVKKFYMVDCVRYAIPCGYDNKVTLGGTQDYGSYDRAADQHTSNSIMEHCSKFVPNLDKAPVIRTWVGFRPHRSRARVELETLNSSVIVHHYGHSGYGVTTSPGSSQYAVKLFSEYHRSGKKIK